MTVAWFIPNVGLMAQSMIRRSRGLKAVGGVAGALLALTVTAGCNDPAAPPQQQQEQEDGGNQQDGDQQDDQQDGDDQDGGDDQDDD
ncbi:hypothetical protein GCM10027271_18340 [Saccharopolyspora gloriosae]